jgi:hypothetical protein
MDGKRVQTYFSNEVKALLSKYEQFACLLPNETKAGASHVGEEGRFVETLLREYLRKFLPKELEVGSGFIFRPAVKTGKSNRDRSGDTDQHSTQIDILIYDTYNYPVYERFNESLIVPPEGVVGVISVKKNLYETEIKGEIEKIAEISELCRIKNTQVELRGPYLAFVGMNCAFSKKRIGTCEWIFNKVKEVYPASNKDNIKFDDLIGYIGALNEWSIFKRKPNDDKAVEAKYILMKHKKTELHLGFQFILTGLLSVYYDETRNKNRRPGFTAFPSNRRHDKELGAIKCNGLR